MLNTETTLTLTIFLCTVLFLIWRPRGLNESIPTSIGALGIFLIGAVSISDVYKILGIVTGASITIISTIIMSIVLESVGFFRWSAYNVVIKAKGSGRLLFWYIMALCFFMTMFFNNDGSILITTPIIIEALALLNLKTHQKIPYLMGGALVATAASAPIGVSNLANLIALKIVGLDLVTYAKIMFTPSMLGILCLSSLIYFYYQKDIPEHISIRARSKGHSKKFGQANLIPPHPLLNKNQAIAVDWSMFKFYIAIIVVVRSSFFALSGAGIPIEWMAILGAIIMIVARWWRQGTGIQDVIQKTPWHILIFAFSMYVIIYGLRNMGFTDILVNLLREPVASDHYSAIFIMGIALTVMSNIFNNLPAVMLGTISLTEMGLEPYTMQIAYLANIIGSDIGSLIMPMGTLATLIWMFILKKHKIPITWRQYLSVTLVVIPISLLVSLLSLYLWSELISYTGQLAG
ncbi:arsenic transporter [Desulforamulus ferrireducens]|uniref:Arsenic transporter n=1 Tax=Desulforamulus ferrireducens TaxID=1833852 RepID=A0A1S6IVI4_9FIRM|nr:arsenic transporter [Desulforamulus ferrireducens]AQS58799.1 arsenic transporter [Desulforamulus ferrireducens]